MIFSAHADAGGIHRGRGVLCLNGRLQVAADARQRTCGIEGVDAIAGEAEHVRACHHVGQELVAHVSLALHAVAEGVGVLGVGLGVGLAHAFEHGLILLRAPNGQGIVVSTTLAVVLSIAAAAASGRNARQQERGEDKGGQFYP